MNVLRHDGDTLGMDGAQVGVFKEADEVRFGRFLERQYGGALESQIRLEVLRDFAHETLERELADQEFRRLLVLAASSKRAIHHSLVSHSSFVLRASANLTNFRVDARLSSRHAPNLTKRDGTRAVSVRLLHACERARKIVSRQSSSSISLASTRIAPTVRIVVPSAPAREWQ